MPEVYVPVPAELNEVKRITPRLATVAGLHIGLLSNLKPNGDVILGRVGELIIEAGGVDTTFREKESCSLPAPKAILDELAASCQGVVLALGD